MNDEIELVYVRRCIVCHVTKPIGNFLFHTSRCCAACVRQGDHYVLPRAMAMTADGREVAYGG